MAIERFRRSSTSGFGSIKAIRPVGATEAARTSQALSQAMNRVSQFAFGQAQEDYRRRAKTEGAQMVQDNGAIPTLRKISEEGGPQDLRQEAAYEVATRVASAELETDARSEISRLFSEAEINDTPYEEFEAQVQDVLTGFPSALADLEPESAAMLRTRLDSVAANSLGKYAERYQKNQIADAQGRALVGIDQRQKDIVQAATEDTDQRDEIVAEQIDAFTEYMRDYGFDEDFISRRVIETREDATEAQIRSDFQELNSVEAQEQRLEQLEENPPPELGVQKTRTLLRSLRAEQGALAREQQGKVSQLSRRIDDEIVDIFSAGGDPTEERMYEIGVAVEATGDEGLKQEYSRAVALRNEVVQFRKMPPDMLQQEINNMRGEGITDEFEVAVVEAAESVLANVNTEADRDPISLGIKQGVIEPAPLNYSSFDKMSESIANRVEIGDQVANHYGVEPKYLTDEEANRISNEINRMNSLEKAELAVGMNAMPPGLWQQLAEKEQGVFAMVSAIGDTNIANRVFEGQDLIRDKLVDMPSRAELTEVYNDVAGDVYTGRDREATIAAAKAYYAASATDRNEFDEDEFESAIQMVTGGIAEINGIKIQLPRQATEDQFDTFVNNFTPAMVERFGGVQNRDPESAAEQIRDLQFKSIGDNRYVVLQSEGASVMNNSGEPFVVVWSPAAQKMADDESIETRRERRDQTSRFEGAAAEAQEANEPQSAGQRRRQLRNSGQ